MKISTVLLPVDFSVTTEREIELAVEVCRAFDARLVLHHNLEAPPLGMARAWEWNASHPHAQGRSSEVESELRRLLANLSSEIAAEATISRGLPVPAILSLAGSLPADLIIVDSHGAGDEGHSSIVARLIAQAPCPVLAAQEGLSDTPGEHLFGDGGLALAVVPTDFSPGATRAVEYALDLARTLPLRLHLLHVCDEMPAILPRQVDHGLSMAGPSAATAEGEALLRLADLVPSDLADVVTCEVVAGNPASCITDVVAQRGANCVIMGEHDDGWRGLLSRDNAYATLRQSRRPIWYVPRRPVS